MQKPIADENARAERLLDAQDKAAQLFDEIERRGMIRPGVGEQELSDEIRDLAAEMFGVNPALASADRAGRREHPAAFPGASAGPGDRRRRHRVLRPRARSSRSGRPTSGARSCSATIRTNTAVRDALPRVWQAGTRLFREPPGRHRRRVVRRTPSRWLAPRASAGAATIAGPPSRGVPAQEDRRDGHSGTSRPDRPSRCGARTRAAAVVTGSSRSI